MTKPVIVLGAGGHAAVVADALQCAKMEVLGFTDLDSSKHGSQLCGLPVLGDDETVLGSRRQDDIFLANGIGGTKGTHLRRALQMRLQSQGWRFAAVRHPSAIVSPHAKVAASAQLLAGSIVQVHAVIGEGAIINTGAIVEHESVVGDYVHVAPGAVLCGFVKIDANSHIGAGSVVRQGIHLGAHTLVGAGAVVVRSFAGHGRLLGVPASVSEFF